MHYETEENYYVFINALSVYAENPGEVPPNLDNSCIMSEGFRDTDISIRISQAAAVAARRKINASGSISIHFRA